MVDEAFAAWRDSLATGDSLEATSLELFRQLRKFARTIMWNQIRSVDPDLEQDIITRAFLRAGTYQGTANFSTWFYRLAYNACMDHVRLISARREVSLTNMLTEPLADPPTPSRMLHLLPRIRGFLSREDFDWLEMMLKGYTLQDIADKYKVSRNSVKQHWQHIKDQIREEYNADSK